MTKNITLAQARRIIRLAEQKERKSKELKIIKQNDKLVGTYWRFRNSYGSGGYWWLYLKVVSHNREQNNLHCLEIQKTSYGNIEIKLNNKYGSSFDRKNPLGSEWIQIDEKAWREGVNTTLSNILSACSQK